MFTIIWWITSIALDSIATWFRKKSLDIWKLSNVMFKLYSHIFGIFAIPTIIYFFWFDNYISNNYLDLLIIFFLCFIWSFNILLWLHIYKKVKLSELLPYSNLDKLFIIIFWFFIFYGTENWSSIITLLISLLTLFLIIWFTIDFKKFKISKIIWLYLIHKIFVSWNILVIWYLLTKYWSITIASMTWFYEFIIFIIIWLLLKDSFKTIIKQEKKFYINRFLTAIFWWSWWILWLIILKEAWVVVATLLWFLSIVFMTFTMKFLLNDSPTKKQIILAFTVLILIWTWYYFK